MEEDVLNLLQPQVQSVIDWKQCMEDMKARFEDKNGGVVQLKGGDEQGINTFFTLLECLFLGMANQESAKPSLAVLEFDPQFGFHTMDDVVNHICAELELEIDDSGRTEMATHPYDSIYSTIGDERFVMIVFKHLNRAEQNIQDNIRKRLTADSREGNKRVIFFLGVEETISEAGLATYDLLDKYKESDILEYFLNRGFGHDDAEKNAQVLLQFQDQGNSAHEVIRLAEFFNQSKEKSAKD